MEGQEGFGALFVSEDVEAALEMLNLNYLEHPVRDLVGSYFINGSNPQKRVLEKKNTVIRLPMVIENIPWESSLMEEPV